MSWCRQGGEAVTEQSAGGRRGGIGIAVRGMIEVRRYHFCGLTGDSDAAHFGGNDAQKGRWTGPMSPWEVAPALGVTLDDPAWVGHLVTVLRCLRGENALLTRHPQGW